MSDSENTDAERLDFDLADILDHVFDDNVEFHGGMVPPRVSIGSYLFTENVACVELQASESTSSSLGVHREDNDFNSTECDIAMKNKQPKDSPFAAPSSADLINACMGPIIIEDIEDCGEWLETIRLEEYWQDPLPPLQLFAERSTTTRPLVRSSKKRNYHSHFLSPMEVQSKRRFPTPGNLLMDWQPFEVEVVKKRRLVDATNLKARG